MTNHHWFSLLMNENPDDRWVLCCGMRRGGSTLSYNLVSALIEKGGVGQRVVKSHEFIPEVKVMARTGQAKVTYVFRDIRDVLVSYHHKNGRSFTEIIRQSFLEGIMAEHAAWVSLPEAYVTQYEVMVADVPLEVRKLAEFLDVKVSVDESEVIAEQFSLSMQQQRIANFNYETEGEGRGQDRYDPSSLLHPNHINSGEVGQWRADLVALQTAYIENICYHYLQDGGYVITSTWLTRKSSFLIYRVILKWILIREFWDRGELSSKVGNKFARMFGFRRGGSQ